MLPISGEKVLMKKREIQEAFPLKKMIIAATTYIEKTIKLLLAFVSNVLINENKDIKRKKITKLISISPLNEK